MRWCTTLEIPINQSISVECFCILGTTWLDVLVKCGLLTDTPEIGDSTGLSGALSFYKVFFGGGGGGYTYIKKMNYDPRNYWIFCYHFVTIISKRKEKEALSLGTFFIVFLYLKSHRELNQISI